jgi:hypothetical protein
VKKSGTVQPKNLFLKHAGQAVMRGVEQLAGHIVEFFFHFLFRLGPRQSYFTVIKLLHVVHLKKWLKQNREAKWIGHNPNPWAHISYN